MIFKSHYFYINYLSFKFITHRQNYEFFKKVILTLLWQLFSLHLNFKVSVSESVKHKSENL